MTEPKPTYTVSNPRLRLGPYLATLTCRRCGATLATVTEYDRKTALILSTREGLPVLAFRARIVCACGAARTFYSAPSSAVRLGIAEAEE
jgi:hypothetical protein